MKESYSISDWLWKLGVFALRGCEAGGRVAKRVRESRVVRSAAALVSRAMASRAGQAASKWLARFADWAWARLRGEMTKGEHAMLDSLREDRELECLLRTKSRADVGQWCNPWWGGAPLWLAVLENEAIVFAHGKRPHVERFAVADLGASRYNAVTSELVLAASEVAGLRRLRLLPVEGWRVMRVLYDAGAKQTG
ncbi:MAG: hypothetical protein FJ224_06880 [Lentisphaerae bacterium]|nr:hypothetical protein [Lentisphaerota bacterium]